MTTRPVMSASRVASLVALVRSQGRADGANLVAFSGGVDSSVVAALVRRAFPERSLACVGVSASLPASQLALAREVARSVGIPLREVATGEGAHPEYLANNGMACYHCKSAL